MICALGNMGLDIFNELSIKGNELYVPSELRSFFLF